MSAQYNYITHKNDLERYYQQGIMNNDEINDFNEAKRIGEQPYSLGTGFPFKATELMKNLLDDIEERLSKQAASNYQHNNGSTFRSAIGR
jgi:hypothetical protein